MIKTNVSNLLSRNFFSLSICVHKIVLSFVAEKNDEKHGSEEDLAPKISKISDNAKSVLADLQSGIGQQSISSCEKQRGICV